MYEKGAMSFDQMSNLGKWLRGMLAEQWEVFSSKVVRRQESKDETIKLLLEWPDGATSECVLIPDDTRRTACISSQVGCPVGCRFCASGLAGLQRQLTTGEIVEQAMRVRQLCEDFQLPISDFRLEDRKKGSHVANLKSGFKVSNLNSDTSDSESGNWKLASA